MPTWNYSAEPVCEIRSKSTEKHEITEMHLFSLPSQLCIRKLLLCLSRLICARCFRHRHGSRLLETPAQPSSLSHSVPLNFLGTFISPVSNRIWAQFTMLHVTPCFRIPHWYRHTIKNKSAEWAKYDSSRTLSSPRLFVFSEVYFPLHNALTESSALWHWAEGGFDQMKVPELRQRGGFRAATDSTY